MTNCQICQSYFKNNKSLFLHFSQKHNISTKDYYDKFLKKENEGMCSCGNKTNFKNLTKGYFKYCSLKCASNSNETIIKRKQTKLEKYGNENYVNAKQNSITWSKKSKKKINEIRHKQKQTILNKYGNENYRNQEKAHQTKLEKYGNKNFTNREKSNTTCLTKYGYNNIFSDKIIQQKIKQTKLEKYGNENYTNREKANQTITFRRTQKLNDLINDKKLNIKIIDVADPELFKFKCDNCNNEFEISSQMFLLRSKRNEIICNNAKCNPYMNYYCGSSKYEKELINFIKSNFNGDIITNDQKIIPPYELDIYLPDLKLAFEFNGLHWHSELFKNSKYHLLKTELCEQKDIHLIQIYEDDWIYKSDIIKSRIMNLLGKSIKIFARKCELKEVNNKDKKTFLNKNHLQGNINSNINLGLYYNNELVSLMTFGNLRKNLGYNKQENHYELLRFCNKLNYSVIGGANKLFKDFINKYAPFSIISYADRSWTNNKNAVYDKLGFKYINNTNPNYYYIINDKKENRFKFRKDVLIKNGYNKNKTESEIMFERNIYRIYDSGNLKYQWIKT